MEFLCIKYMIISMELIKTITVVCVCVVFVVVVLFLLYEQQMICMAPKNEQGAKQRSELSATLNKKELINAKMNAPQPDAITITIRTTT